MPHPLDRRSLYQRYLQTIDGAVHLLREAVNRGHLLQQRRRDQLPRLSDGVCLRVPEQKTVKNGVLSSGASVFVQLIS